MALTTPIESDCAPLNGLIDALLAAAPGVRFLRDATRGGLATVLNEIAEASQVAIEIDETATPIREEVKAFCEILGLDPLYLANEGKIVVVAPPEEAEAALAAMRAHPLGATRGDRRAHSSGRSGARDDAHGFRRAAHRRHAGRRAIAADLLRQAMHELSITRNIVAIVEEAAKGRRVRRVTLEVGELSGVVSEAIAFCFDVVTAGTALEGASLEIRKIEGRARCESCGAEFATATLFATCDLRFRPVDAVAGRRAERQVDGTDGGCVMCGHCGCGGEADATVLNLETGKETVDATRPSRRILTITPIPTITITAMIMTMRMIIDQHDHEHDHDHARRRGHHHA